MHSLSYTVTMDANLAKHVGIAAAMLYNLLCWYAQSDMVQNYDPEGWFYFTAKQFEEHTTYSRNWFTKTADKLEEVGLIERKRMYIHHSSVSCTHFRVLQYDWKVQFQESQRTTCVQTPHTKCELNNIEEKKKKYSRNPDSRISDEAPSFPFGAELKTVSVRPLANNEEAAKRRRSFAILGELYKELGYLGKPDKVESAHLTKLLDDGWTVDNIKDALKWMDNNDFWKDKSLKSRLSGGAMKQYDAVRRKPRQFDSMKDFMEWYDAQPMEDDDRYD